MKRKLIIICVQADTWSLQALPEWYLSHKSSSLQEYLNLRATLFETAKFCKSSIPFYFITTLLLDINQLTLECPYRREHRSIHLTFTPNQFSKNWSVSDTSQPGNKNVCCHYFTQTARCGCQAACLLYLYKIATTFVKTIKNHRV